MEKKGCQAILVILGVLMIIGMVLGGQLGNQHPQTPEERVVFEVGSQKVTAKQFNERVQKEAQSQQTQGMVPGTANAEFSSHMKAIQSYVNDAAIASLAKEKGVFITDSNIRTLGESVATQYMDSYRAQLIQQGVVKSNATRDEVDKKITELSSGKKPGDLIKEQTDEIVKKYGDASTKTDVINALLPVAIQDSYKAGVQFTEEDLKAAFNDYDLSVIKFDDLSKPLEDRQSAAIDAIEKIKAGKDFATVQAEVNPKAKPEDKKSTLSGGMLDAIPDLKPIAKLKPGEISDMILAGGTPTIYKLNAVKQNLPKDFEKSKATLLENGKASKAGQLFDADSKKKIESLTPKFEDKGLGICYDIFTNASKPEYQANPEKQKEFFKEKLSELRKDDFSTDGFQNIIVAAQFLLQENLYASATDAEKKEMLDDRIESANNMLSFFEDNSFRLALAKDLLEKGRNDDALTFALAAAQNNGDFERAGQGVYAQIGELITTAETKKAWSKESLDEMNKEQNRWQDEYAKYVTEQKEIEEAQKKAQEELDKELATQGKDKPTTGTTGTAPPVGGATIPKSGN
ncbi:MAG: SurA N-terminal domain-containing protein [Fimbriimonadaceae bacterium]